MDAHSPLSLACWHTALNPHAQELNYHRFLNGAAIQQIHASVPLLSPGNALWFNLTANVGQRTATFELFHVAEMHRYGMSGGVRLCGIVLFSDVQLNAF